MADSNKNITYLNKDFTDFKSALIEYAKSYFPTAYNDFSSASPGTMFIEMASYVGDVLSFYMDNQIQETFLEYAKQKENLYSLAYMLGYKPKVTSAATVDVEVYQLIPSTGPATNKTPDYNYALIINENMQIKSSTIKNATFIIPEKINFAVENSMDKTDISVYSYDGIGDPLFYLLKKTRKALSGEVKTVSFSYGTAEKFITSLIQDTNIIEIIDAYDSDGNRWYEVPFLAQDTILDDTLNVSYNDPNYSQESNITPYILKLKKVPRRFATRVKSNNSLELQFGSGINQNADESVLPNSYNVGIGLIDGLSKINTAFNPSNFTTTETYGLAPTNTTLTVRYLVGGGTQANIPSNQLNTVQSYSSSFYGGIVDNVLSNQILQSIQINNPTQAVGGGDGDTIEQIRLNSISQFPTQMRAVTQQDYASLSLSMPGKYGQISKAFVTKDDIVFKQDVNNNNDLVDPLSTSIYVLGFNENKQLITPSDSLKQNLKGYLSQYRILTDSINIKNAFIINIGVDFDIILRPNYSGRDVLLECLTLLQSYFNIDNWEINQPIILSEIYTMLDNVSGVQTVNNVKITNKSGEELGYSKYSYDIQSATLNNVIYPSLDPSIFEVKNLQSDIQGRIVTF
jgi:hypothetical protein